MSRQPELQGKCGSWMKQCEMQHPNKLLPTKACPQTLSSTSLLGTNFILSISDN